MTGWMTAQDQALEDARAKEIFQTSLAFLQ
jgi:hypothetical protein